MRRLLLLLSLSLVCLAQKGTTTGTSDVITTSGTTFLSSTRAATSSATSSAMISLSTTSLVSSSTIQAETTSTSASATSLSTSVTSAALSLSTSSRISSLAASSTTSVQSTSTTSFIATTSIEASLSSSAASSTTTAATTVASTTSYIPSSSQDALLQVIFRASCINADAFIFASNVPSTYVVDYDGCNSTLLESMLLVGADVAGIDQQEHLLRQSQLYFGNQSAVSSTRLLRVPTAGPLDTHYPGTPTGPPVKYPGPATWVVILLVVLGGVIIVVVGFIILGCITKRTIDKGYAAVSPSP